MKLESSLWNKPCQYVKKFNGTIKNLKSRLGHPQSWAEFLKAKWDSGGKEKENE